MFVPPCFSLLVFSALSAPLREPLFPKWDRNSGLLRVSAVEICIELFAGPFLQLRQPAMLTMRQATGPFSSQYQLAQIR